MKIRDIVDLQGVKNKLPVSPVIRVVYGRKDKQYRITHKDGSVIVTDEPSKAVMELIAKNPDIVEMKRKLYT